MLEIVPGTTAGESHPASALWLPRASKGTPSCRRLRQSGRLMVAWQPKRCWCMSWSASSATSCLRRVGNPRCWKRQGITIDRLTLELTGWGGPAGDCARSTT